MKKISALLLAVVMAFGMAGCSDSGSSDSDNESSAAAVQTESSAADSSEDATATTTTTTTAPAVTESSQAEQALLTKTSLQALTATILRLVLSSLLKQARKILRLSVSG